MKQVSQFNILVVRVILGVVFGIFLSRFFYPNAPLVFIIGLVLILVGLAYLSEYLRNRKKDRR
jgi:F0F1-type ATP synthase assembly protein I